MYKVIFYKTARNEEPVAKYLKTLDIKVRVKFYKLRIKYGSNQYRTLYFFFERDYIVITHGFTKKTDQVLEAEITRAHTYREDFKAQIAKGATYEPKKI